MTPEYPDAKERIEKIEGSGSIILWNYFKHNNHHYDVSMTIDSVEELEQCRKDILIANEMAATRDD